MRRYYKVLVIILLGYMFVLAGCGKALESDNNKKTLPAEDLIVAEPSYDSTWYIVSKSGSGSYRAEKYIWKPTDNDYIKIEAELRFPDDIQVKTENFYDCVTETNDPNGAYYAVTAAKITEMICGSEAVVTETNEYGGIKAEITVTKKENNLMISKPLICHFRWEPSREEEKILVGNRVLLDYYPLADGNVYVTGVKIPSVDIEKK